MNNICFERKHVPLVTSGIVISILKAFFIFGICIAAYVAHPNMAWLLFLAAYFLIYPILLLLLRLKYLRFDRDAQFSIDLEKQELVYEHKNKHVVFHSTDIEEWIYYKYGELYFTYIDILELRLKNGEVIYIHGGMKQICRTLKRFRSQLGMPEEEYRYNNWKFLFNHIRMTLSLR